MLLHESSPFGLGRPRLLDPNGQLRHSRMSHRHNQLTRLPPAIGNLTGLKELLLGGNRLTWLPAELGNLDDLTELFLEDNRLKELPSELERLTGLSILYLYGNELGQSDFDFSRLANLTHVLIETPR